MIDFSTCFAGSKKRNFSNFKSCIGDGNKRAIHDQTGCVDKLIDDAVSSYGLLHSNVWLSIDVA
jgi:hypothetical protein